MKRVFFVGVACALLMHAMVSAQQITTTAAAPGDALSFFKNFFVTGDYVVAGVSLRGTGVNGFATGAIDLTGADIPDRADIMGAFLYWETVATQNSTTGASGAGFRSTLPGELPSPPIAAYS